MSIPSGDLGTPATEVARTSPLQQPTARCLVSTPTECALLIDAVRRGDLPLIHRRLDTEEAGNIAHGNVYVWEEAAEDEIRPKVHGSASIEEKVPLDVGEDSIEGSLVAPGIRRWTDGRRWGASRVTKAGFLVYVEIDRIDKSKLPKAERAARKSKKQRDEALMGEGMDMKQKGKQGKKRKRVGEDEGEPEAESVSFNIAQGPLDPALEHDPVARTPADSVPTGTSSGTPIFPHFQPNPFQPHLPPHLQFNDQQSFPFSDPSHYEPTFSTMPGYPYPPSIPPYTPDSSDITLPSHSFSAQQLVGSSRPQATAARPAAPRQPQTDRNGVPTNRNAKVGGLIKQSWSVIIDDTTSRGLTVAVGHDGSAEGGAAVDGNIGSIAIAGARQNFPSVLLGLEESSGKAGLGLMGKKIGEDFGTGSGRRWHVVGYYAQDANLHPPLPLASQLPEIIPHAVKAATDAALAAAIQAALKPVVQAQAGPQWQSTVAEPANVRINAEPSGSGTTGQAGLFSRDGPETVLGKRTHEDMDMVALKVEAKLEPVVAVKKGRKGKKGDAVADSAPVSTVDKVVAKQANKAKMATKPEVTESSLPPGFDPTANAFPIPAKRASPKDQDLSLSALPTYSPMPTQTDSPYGRPTFDMGPPTGGPGSAFSRPGEHSSSIPWFPNGSPWIRPAQGPNPQQPVSDEYPPLFQYQAMNFAQDRRSVLPPQHGATAIPPYGQGPGPRIPLPPAPDMNYSLYGPYVDPYGIHGPQSAEQQLDGDRSQSTGIFQQPQISQDSPGDPGQAIWNMAQGATQQPNVAPGPWGDFPYHQFGIVPRQPSVNAENTQDQSREVGGQAISEHTANVDSLPSGTRPFGVMQNPQYRWQGQEIRRGIQAGQASIFDRAAQAAPLWAMTETEIDPLTPLVPEHEGSDSSQGWKAVYPMSTTHEHVRKAPSHPLALEGVGTRSYAQHFGSRQYAPATPAAETSPISTFLAPHQQAGSRLAVQHFTRHEAPPSLTITTPNGTAGPFATNDPFFDRRSPSITPGSDKPAPIGLGIVTELGPHQTVNVPISDGYFPPSRTKAVGDRSSVNGWIPDASQTAGHQNIAEVATTIVSQPGSNTGPSNDNPIAGPVSTLT